MIMMYLFITIPFISNYYSAISNFISTYGYFAIFFLMLLEGSSLPVPSEVVLPLAGLLSAKGILNFYLAFLAALGGSVAGLIIDYSIGYYIGKEVIYRHLKFFHIKKSSLDSFDAWFERNGIAAIFFSRLLPVVRTMMSFPAGFAKMRLGLFLSYSILGTTIWDLVLMLFGFYFLSAQKGVVVLTSIGVFALGLYVIYTYAMRRIKRSARQH